MANHGSRRASTCFLLALVCLWCARSAGAGVSVGIAGSSDFGEGGRVSRRLIDEWARATGNTITYVGKPNSYSQAFSQFLVDWSSQTSDIDVYSIDTTWQGIAAPYAVDLSPYFSQAELQDYFPQVIRNNIVDGELVSVPTSVDVGLLYYRTDLLAEYGFTHPPQTWQELTDMARTIQAGERAHGDADFYGYLWQGKDESVACNLLEWIFSSGGGSIIERDGRVSIDNPNAIRAMNLARSWLGTISPPGTITYAEEECRNLFQDGKAAFMRNWPYVYVLADNPACPIHGKFTVAPLPKGDSPGVSAGALGGWSLMVSKYSKHPDVAAEFVRYFASVKVQKEVALELSGMPSRPALYSDPDILNKYPWFAKLPDIFEHAIARPSTLLGANYNRLAYLVAHHADLFLHHAESAEEAVKQIEIGAKKLTANGH